ncbi:MAG: TolC family protein [Bacteroidota bacterium]
MKNKRPHIHRSSGVKFFILLIIGLGNILVASSQEGEEAYDLDDLISEALENNYDIRVSETDLEISEANNTRGNAGMLPSLMFESDFSNSFNDRTGSINQSGNLQNGVRLNWVLFNGFSAHVRKDRLETLEELADGQLAMVVENTIQAVVLAYYRTLFEQERLELFREIMQLSEDRLRYIKDRVDMGAATSYDTLQARTAYLSDKASFLDQEVQVISSLREVKYLTGMPEGENIELAGDLNFEPGDYALDQLLDQMENNNQSIRNQYLNLALRENQKIQERRSRSPSLSAGAGATHNLQPDAINDSQTTNQYPGDEDSYMSYYINFSLSFNLFDGNRVNRNIEIAEMEEEIARTNLEEMKHRLQNRLLNLYDTYRVRRELVEVGRENMETSRINMMRSEEKFRSGTINSFNYRDVQMSYMEASINYYRSVLNLVDTHTELVRITGGIVDEF